MRTLAVNEAEVVSGGSCEGPVIDLPPVDITARRPGRRTLQEPTVVITDSLAISDFLANLSGPTAGSGGFGTASHGVGPIQIGWLGSSGVNSSSVGDTVIGYPVDLNSTKDSVDYAKEWKAVFEKMSPLELKAFDAALEKAYKDAIDKFNFGLAEKLHGFKEADGNADKMGMASSYAAQNMSQVNLVLLETILTSAYAAAAALPGGI